MRVPRRLIVTVAAGHSPWPADRPSPTPTTDPATTARRASATVTTTAASTWGNAILRAALFGSKTAAHGGPPLFGVNPGGLDWVINDKGKAKVSRGGRVRVRIEGLVFAEGPNLGKNTLPQLAATVYCGGTAVGTTAPVAFSPEGDARIDETLATRPPSPCLAPAVLINPAPAGTAVTGTYIAASGA